jgi:hypothetical protein
MTNLTVKLKESDAYDRTEVEISNVRDLTVDFYRGTVRFTFNDESGPQNGEYALNELEDIDWNVVKDTPEVGPALTTYQLRAMHNLPPKIPGAPDYTYEPSLPRTLSPTPIIKPAGVGEVEVRKAGEKRAS